LSGRLGDRLGRGLGNSLDFVEHRDYAPGDDLRLLDWRAYARTDRMFVRRYRAEVAPVVEVVVDLSASMAVTDAKGAALRELVEGFWHWGTRGIGRVRVLARGGGVLDVGPAGHGLPRPEGPGGGSWLPAVPFVPGSLRYLVSDFLEPGDPHPDLRRMAHSAAWSCAVQLLDPWEHAPDPADLTALWDCEGDRRLDVELGDATLARYAERLGRLCGQVRHAVAEGGGRYALALAAEPERMFADALHPAGIIEPARGGA